MGQSTLWVLGKLRLTRVFLCSTVAYWRTAESQRSHCRRVCASSALLQPRGVFLRASGGHCARDRSLAQETSLSISPLYSCCDVIAGGLSLCLLARWCCGAWSSGWLDYFAEKETVTTATSLLLLGDLMISHRVRRTRHHHSPGEDGWPSGNLWYIIYKDDQHLLTQAADSVVAGGGVGRGGGCQACTRATVGQWKRIRDHGDDAAHAMNLNDFISSRRSPGLYIMQQFHWTECGSK